MSHIPYALLFMYYIPSAALFMSCIPLAALFKSYIPSAALFKSCIPSAALAAHEGVLLAALVLEVAIQVVVPVIRPLHIGKGYQSF